MNTKLFSVVLLIFAVAIFTGCKEDDACEELMVTCGPNGTCNEGFCECDEGWKGVRCDQVAATETLTGFLNADKTLEGDKIYEIIGKYVVSEGATLTISPGTILKFALGQETAASALIVAKGGKIEADGTANKPIIMTSVLDNIEPGQITGTNLSKSDVGLWGGLIILGNANVSAMEGNTQGRIEGIPESEGYGLYGGDDNEDDSGILNYVSVRHAGVLIGEDNEINGITLAGVGSKTKIENVEVVANFDDGIECFGGSVNIKNAIVVYQGDDGIDIDQNYSGTIDNFYVKHGASPKTDFALEIDGPENETYTNGKFTLLNGTVRNDGMDGGIADLKSKAQGTIENVSFEGYANLNFIKVRASYDTNTANSADVCETKADSYSHMVNGDLVISTCELVHSKTTLSNLANGYADGNDTPCRYTGEEEAELDKLISDGGNSIAGSATKGANLAVFKGWTWASEKGEL